jgi:hypothetical protein
VKVGAFFDYVDFDEDVAFMADHLRHTFEATHHPDQIARIAPGTDYFFIDYGGLSGIGQSGFLDATERLVEHAIEDNPSTLFIFILTMGKEFYADSIFENTNVECWDRAMLGSLLEGL